MALLAVALLLLATAAATEEQQAPAAWFCSMVVAVAPDATEPERMAAGELAILAGQVCDGAVLTIATPAAAKGRPQLAVGAGAAMALGIAPADLQFTALGKDGFVASSNRTETLRTTAHMC